MREMVTSSPFGNPAEAMLLYADEGRSHTVHARHLNDEYEASCIGDLYYGCTAAYGRRGRAFDPGKIENPLHIHGERTANDSDFSLFQDSDALAYPSLREATRSFASSSSFVNTIVALDLLSSL